MDEMKIEFICIAGTHENENIFWMGHILLDVITHGVSTEIQ